MKQNGFFAEVIKTTRVEVDNNAHLLPPHRGVYKEYKVADYFCPDEWSKDGVFIPVKEGDPIWFDFTRNKDECAILCAVQRINPVTGEPADLEAGLSKDPTQNYLSMPEQRWLDGYAKDGKVYQFIVTKAGIGLAVNEYVLPKHMQDSHAIGFAFFAPKNPKPKPASPTRGASIWDGTNPMWFSPLNTPQNWLVSKKISTTSNATYGSNSFYKCAGAAGGSGGEATSEESEIVMAGASASLDNDSVIDNENVCYINCAIDTDTSKASAIETVDILAEQEQNLNELEKASMGAGGRIIQKIVPDENTVDYYHEKRSALLTIYFALPEMFEAIMGKGKRQDASRKDKYKTSGHIGGVAVPLISQNID